MCGICGIFDFKGERADRGLLERMNERIRHRGPDGDGFYVCGPVGLANRRLSIIDLDGGWQPQTNEDSSIQVVFNGEIYNFIELREELLAKGHKFKTRSDTEVIVHAYEEWGDDCTSRFNGIFAFALWDSNRRRLLIARDHLGVKPLYYVQLGSRRSKLFCQRSGRNSSGRSKNLGSRWTMYSGISTVVPRGQQ